VALGGQGDDVILGGGGDDHLVGDEESQPLYQHARYTGYAVQHTVEDVRAGKRIYSYRYTPVISVEQREGGDDVIYGGGGQDWIFGQGGDDRLDGGADEDVVFGGEDADTIYGGAGADVLSGDDLDDSADPETPGLPGVLHGQDFLDGGAGDDLIVGNGNDDVLYGDEGNDQIDGDDAVTPGEFHGDDYIDGGAGDDILVGSGGDDEIRGGAGDDYLDGDESSLDARYHGKDVLSGGEGRDELHGEAGDDYLDGGDGDDLAFGEAGNDQLFGGAGDDGLGGGDSNDTLDGGEGADILVGEAGNDQLLGGAGDDQLSGGDGDDLLIGGAGADVLDGGLGDDTYVIDAAATLAASGGVIDLIQDAGGVNTLVLEGVDIGAVEAGQAVGSNDLVVDFSGAGQLVIANGMAGTIRSFGLGNGAVLTPVEFLESTVRQTLNLDIATDNALLAGGRGDDRLRVNGSGNTLAGGKGNDLIEVAGGNNVIDYRPGDGVDTLRSLGPGNAPSRIRLGAGIAAADLRLSLDGGDLVVGIGANPDSALRLAGFDRDRPFENPPIGALQFAGGGTLTYGELLASGIELAGTADGDAVDGTGFNDRIRGLAGDDVLNGAAGDDTLTGAEGNDVLNGGTGDDVLIGGEGADVYVVNAGSGSDTLVDADGGRIELGVGISLADIDARRDGTDLVMRMPGAAASAVIQGYFDAPQAWVIHDTSGGTATAAELLSGTSAREREWLQALKTDYEQSSKLAVVNERIGQGYQYTGANELRRYRTTDALASFVSGQQTQVNQIQWFSGGTSTDTRTYSLDDWRPAQSPAIQDDRFRVATNTVQASSAFYADTWSRQQSSYQIQRWVGLGWTTTSLSAQQTSRWNGVSIVTSGSGATGILTSTNTRTYQSGFARGSIAGILSAPPALIPPPGQLFPNVGRATYSGSDATYTFQIVQGDAGDNEITGGNLVEAGAGNDTVTTQGMIDGGDGDDRLYNGAAMFGGRGDDQLWGRDISSYEVDETNRYYFAGLDQGTDLVIDEGWIGFYEGEPEYYYAVLDPFFSGIGVEHWSDRYFHGGQWTIDGAWNAYFGSEEEAQAYAASLSQEGITASVLYLDVLPENLQLKANDSAGLAPLVRAGYIAEDVVRFGPGIAPEDLAFAWGSVRLEGNDAFHFTLDITYGAGSVARIVVPNADDLLGWGIESFRFADGRSLTMGEMIALAPPRPEYNDIVGTDYDDWLLGTDISDRIAAGAGNDLLMGLGGDDVLDGGEGNDTLVGHAGNDVYRFGRGSGQDQVDQSYADPAEADTVRFADDVASADVTVSRDNGTLVLTIRDTGEALSLLHWFDWIENRVARVEFADGTAWDAATLEQRIVAPQNNAPVVNQAIGAQAAIEDQPFVFRLPEGAFVDPDAGDQLHLRAELVEGTPLPAWLSFDAGTRSFSGTPGNAEVGTLSVRVTATDDAGASASDVFAFSVTNANDAPFAANAVADQAATEGQAFSFTVPADAFADIDVGDTLSYSANLANGDPLPSWLSFDAATRTLSGTPPQGAPATLTLRVSGQDQTGATASDDFAISIGRTLTGTGYGDTLTGTDYADLLIGGGGRDVLNGAGGDDTFLINGSDAEYDTFNGGAGFDTILGGAGNDTLRVHNLAPANGIERIDGGAGVNVIAGLGDNDVIDLTGIEVLNIAYIDGGGYSDTITGTEGADTIVGGGGRDVLNGAGGNDT
ncbi:MAG: hypothetical protein C0522_10605, partial [Rhodocyclaceae bacterium]|nr:hypothetical protein [Rhodocyclaceae bacterium]